LTKLRLITKTAKTSQPMRLDQIYFTMAAISDSGGLPNLVYLSDNESDSLEEREQPSEEEEVIISSWVAGLPQQSKGSG
jgi:hypothetical protein